MKCIIILISFLLTSSIFAGDDRQLLKCLGAEEKKMHLAKELGPIYDLNQRLISEILQIPKVDVSPNNFNYICKESDLPPSWKLLELSIREGRNLFIIPTEVSGMQKEVTMGMIEDYIEATKEILLEFIFKVQSLAPTHTCLKEEIPELDKFFNDIKYLQEDIELKQIFDGRGQKIFKKLKDYPAAYKRCFERTKKKAKPALKKDDKKP